MFVPTRFTASSLAIPPANAADANRGSPIYRGSAQAGGKEASAPVLPLRFLSCVRKRKHLKGEQHNKLDAIKRVGTTNCTRQEHGGKLKSLEVWTQWEE